VSDGDDDDDADADDDENNMVVTVCRRKHVSTNNPLITQQLKG